MKTARFLFLGFALRVLGADFVVPVAGGNSATVYPFVPNDGRYQQVYGAAAFSSLTPVGGGWITAIQFRIASGGLSPGFRTINAQINFSTTVRPVDGLSTVFAENVGTDEQMVLSSTTVVPFDGRFGPLGNAALIPLTTPFFYNPGAGNLLLDLRMYSGLGPGNPTDPTAFDASNLPNDRSSALIGFNRDSVTGIPDTTSLITGFSITPAVPEPSPAALAVAAIIVASLFGLRRKQPNRKE